MHWDYNRQNYPIFVGNHGNWDIYRNEADRCVSLPTPEAAAQGCIATHFGNMAYVRQTLGEDWLEQQSTGKLSQGPEIDVIYTAKDPEQAALGPFRVGAWLRMREAGAADGEGGPHLEFCGRKEATHVLGFCLWGSNLEPPVQRIAALDAIRLEGSRVWRSHHVREQAYRLAEQHALLGSVKVNAYN